MKPPIATALGRAYTLTLVSPERILSKEATREAYQARYGVIWVARHKHGYTVTRIGREMGRDASSISSALIMTDRLQQRDKRFAKFIGEMMT